MPAHAIVHHPFAYGIGPVSITGFGIAILMCFLVGQSVAQGELARRGYDPKPVADMTFAAVIGGLLGAKLYYVVILRHWDTMFDRSGFVFWGGLIGGTIAVMYVVRRTRYGVLRMFDVGGPACAAAYAVGRTGCWAVGDDYGKPWNGFLAVAFPEGSPPSTVAVMTRDFGVHVPADVPLSTVMSVYPTQLLEVLLGFVMFLALWRMRDHRHAEGWLFGVYCVLAGLERFVVEFFRAKDDRLVGPLTYAQLIALAFIAGGIVIMLVLRRITPERPGIYAPEAARAA